MTTGTVHVVGAGLAGLAAAVAAARAGARVVLHEAAGHAGGRCRSFRDDTIGRVIDNGTHLVLGVNRLTLAFARGIGGVEAMSCGTPEFPFLDMASGRQWTMSPLRLAARPLELLRAAGLPWTGEDETVAIRLGAARSYHMLWEPLCVAALNTAADEASARLFAQLLRAALRGGRQALAPWIFPMGLSAALVAPALATLAAHGAELRFRHRLLGTRPGGLDFDDGALPLSPADRVVLALPPWALAEVAGGVPALSTRAIVNAHFRLDQPATLPGGRPYLGLTGGVAQWLSLRDDVLSVTVSAADRLAAEPAYAVGALLWREVAAVIGHPDMKQPATRIMKERRATLLHSPAEVRLRPGPQAGPLHAVLPNTVLAGDWLASSWPCTIEAAISSGLAAARLALDRPQLAFAD
jgi:hypothetical protein